MDEHELEDVMHQFVSGAADVLISTTIIESGLDIPNANTIIIDRADRFGLADLYQLRGRVGRAQHKAYAYLMLPREMMTRRRSAQAASTRSSNTARSAPASKSPCATWRSAAPATFSAPQQSGHIVNIGFDLYCALLRQAIAKLKGEKVQGARSKWCCGTDFVATREAEFAQKSSAEWRLHSCPPSYISESQPRIQAYRRLAEVSTAEQLEALRKTWRDRFGPLPDAVENLLLMTEIKLLAAARKMTVVEVREDKVMLTRGGDYILIGGKFPRLHAAAPNQRLTELAELIRSF